MQTKKTCLECNQLADASDTFCRACGYRFFPSRNTITRPEQLRAIKHPSQASPPPPQQERRNTSVLAYLLAATFTLAFGYAILSFSGNLQSLAPQRTTPIILPTHTPTRHAGRTFSVKQTQTPTRTPTSVPTAKPKSVIKTLKYSNVRAGPGTNYPVLKQVAQNQSVNPTGRNADGSWIRIEVNSTVGWIWAPLTTMKDTVSLSTVAIPPVPIQTEITNTPTTRPTPTTPPTPTRTGTFYPGYCSELIPQGVVPKGGWTRDNINYRPERDGDKDGYACEN